MATAAPAPSRPRPISIHTRRESALWLTSVSTAAASRAVMASWSPVRRRVVRSSANVGLLRPSRSSASPWRARSAIREDS